jgi:hypothetical protein
MRNGDKGVPLKIFAGPFSTWELLTPSKDRLEALTMSLDLKDAILAALSSFHDPQHLSHVPCPDKN